MFSFIIAIHATACALLIILVLIQQGKGGGLIGSLSSAESIFGTKTNDFLVKSTSILAIVFFFTCLSLAFLSIQRNKSIITTKYKQKSTTEEKKPLTTAPIAVSTTPTAALTETTATALAVNQTATAPIKELSAALPVPSNPTQNTDSKV